MSFFYLFSLIMTEVINLDLMKKIGNGVLFNTEMELMSILGYEILTFLKNMN
jgi:hypothetical protein